MKNTILTILAIFIVNSIVMAQDFGFKKGSKFIEGNIRYEYYDDSEYAEKSKVLNLTPTFGYFIKDNLAIGTKFMFFESSDLNTDNDSGEKAHGFGVGVFGRYYFLNLGTRFKTYAELDLSYGNSHVYDVDNGVETVSPDFISYNAAGNVGFNFFLTKRLSINYELSNVLYGQTSKNDVAGAKRGYQFETNLNIFNNIFSESTFGLNFNF